MQMISSIATVPPTPTFSMASRVSTAPFTCTRPDRLMSISQRHGRQVYRRQHDDGGQHRHAAFGRDDFRNKLCRSLRRDRVRHQLGSPNVGSWATTNQDGTFNEFEGRGGDDIIVGNGDTRISYLHATSGVTVNIASGTADGDASVGHDTFSGVNSVRGSYFDDTLIGSNNPTGAENFEGRGGNDTIDGGGGFDRAVYANEDHSIAVDLGGGIVTGGPNLEPIRCTQSKASLEQNFPIPLMRARLQFQVRTPAMQG